MELFANNAGSTLNGAINNTVTTLVVASVTSFPATGNFRILIDNEIMLVTSISGNTFTVFRGQEGTTAASHANGVSVDHILTKEALKIFRQETITAGPIGSRPTAGVPGRIYFTIDSPFSFYDNGTNWQFVSGSQLIPYGPINLSNWTWVNQGTATAVAYGEGVYFTHQGNLSGDDFKILTKALPSAPYNVTMAIKRAFVSYNHVFPGIGVRESSSGKFVCFTCFDDEQISVDTFNSATAGVSNLQRLNVPQGGGIIFLRIADDSTNRKYQVSFDNNNFITVLTTTNTNWVTPNQVMFGMDVTNNNNPPYPSWFLSYIES